MSKRFTADDARELVATQQAILAEQQAAERIIEVRKWAECYSIQFDNIFHSIKHAAMAERSGLSVSNKSIIVRQFVYEDGPMIKEYFESYGFQCSIISSRGGLHPYIDSIKIYWPTISPPIQFKEVLKNAKEAQESKGNNIMNDL